ncbi:hypothetical protein [Bradyrhizobium erythrophlei]|jgi:hypothetical protein|uniref:Uncharacterized protein n=1 Tax=Bradyrhizobium erythrophlei TaxID=1437360 RepID=A0A1M5UFF4_9BRAD|nr:hypothetical protein [Bradyrhizobium erythrophlei]SHH61699.1 hypothetical protein SAMN05444169_8377 [Bradyrhizobium erythrophlei]
MSDIASILSAAYKAVGAATTVPSKTKYVAVDPKLYQGTWSGTYADKKTFTIQVLSVSGFRAQVKYQSAGTVKFGTALIKDNSFRIGDTKLTLTKLATSTRAATATVKNVLTDPATGSTYLDTAVATLSS